MSAGTSHTQGLPRGISFLQSTINLAEELRTKVEAGQFQDISPIAKALHSKGVEMTQGEVSGLPLYNDDESVMPIITRLEAIVAHPDTKDQPSIMRQICKSYRVFIELRAHQPWRIKIRRPSESMPIDTTLREQFISTTINAEKIIRKRTGAMSAIFELRCARQAARRLTPTEPLWQKYGLFILDTAATINGPGLVDVGALWQTFRNFVSSVKIDNRLAEFFWYEDVKVARWEATAVRTLDGYNQTVVPRIAPYKHKGGNHSLCLVEIFMALIQNPNVDKEVKMKAFGDATVEGLIHAINWEPEKMPRGLLRKATDSLQSLTDIVVTKGDRYWETRQVGVYYLGKIAQKEKYPPEFRELSLHALRIRQKLLSDRKSGHSIADEKQGLRDKLIEVNQTIETLTKDYIKVGGDKIHLAEKRTLPTDMGGPDCASIQDRVGLQTEDPEILYQASEQLLALKSDCLNELHTEAENELNEVNAMLELDILDPAEYIPLSTAIDQSELNLIKEILPSEPEISG